MKLRCTHNSLRLRLRKSDLDRLAQTGSVTESVLFLNQNALLFTLETDVISDDVAANFTAGRISVSLPRDTAENWMSSNQVGIETTIEMPGGESLHVLVEKDFPCLDRENEDKSDTFWELAQEKDKADLNC